MKTKIIVSIFSCLLLASCMQTQAEHTTQKETRLWQQANAQASKDCAQFPRADRAQAMAADACIGNVVRKIVMPYAAYPDLVAHLIEDQSAVNSRYAAGQIDQKQADAEARQLQARYQAVVMARLQGMVNAK